eukprot:scaffold21347_cov54-Attheya_sp.AAC.3
MAMCRYLGMEATLSQHVESDCCLLQHSVPQLKWKTGVDSAQASKEVVLEGLDCLFCIVLAMHSGRGKDLIGNGAFVDFALHGSGTLVVEDMILGCGLVASARTLLIVGRRACGLGCLGDVVHPKSMSHIPVGMFRSPDDSTSIIGKHA